MTEFTDEEFLSYCEAHSEAPRALFSAEHINRLYALAEEQYPKLFGHAFLAMHEEIAKPLVMRARKLISLNSRINELEAAIKEHRRQHADDRCWEDDIALYEVLNDEVKPDNHVGDPAAMLWNCARFIRNRCQGGNWRTYESLENELIELRELTTRFRDSFYTRSDHHYSGIDILVWMEKEIDKIRERYLDREVSQEKIVDFAYLHPILCRECRSKLVDERLIEAINRHTNNLRSIRDEPRGITCINGLCSLRGRIYEEPSLPLRALDDKT